MSTARAQYKEDKHAAKHSGKDHKKPHPFRTALWISLALAALVLWQLNPIIHGLHSLDATLGQAEGLRQVVGGILTTSYHRIVNTIGPIVHHIIH